MARSLHGGIFRGMACPFFMPVERLEGGAWLHPSRLPLGDGWRGFCTAASPDSPKPGEQHLQSFCNLGYAASCSHLPHDRSADAVRFSIARVSDNLIAVRYVCERDHRPGEHGTLEFVKAEQRWILPHPDSRIQKMAECYLESYQRKASSSNSVTASAVVS